MRSALVNPVRLAMLLLATYGCAEQPTVGVIPPAAFLAKGGPGPQPSVPLVITVVETPNMASDGVTEPGYAPGEYVSGLHGMLAELDGPGNLQFSPENAFALPPQRTLALTYGAQLTMPAGPWDPNVYMPNQHNWKVKTGNADKPRIQDLAIGASDCYATTIASDGGGASSSVTFMHHRALFYGPNRAGSTFARITRSGTASWTMVSDGGCAGGTNAAAVESQDLTNKRAPLIYRGLYTLQFSLILRQK